MRGSLIPSSGEYKDNYQLEKLYNHEIENGRFFKVVFQEIENAVNIQISKKIFLQIKYIPSRNDIEGFEITKLENGVEKQKISFHKFNFQQLDLFLQFIRDIDLSIISDRKIKLADNSFDIIDDKTKKKIATLLQGDEGEELIKNLLENEIVTSQDIINTAYRKSQLKIYKKLLEEEYYLQIYKTEEKNIALKISDFELKVGKTIDEKSKDEIAWQHFFNRNPWIFGYGLDYRFQHILQKEFSASNTDAAGKGQVNADFLIGDNNFTTFVELKTPNTDIFDNKVNRSGSWKLSKDLTYAVSQILEQKAAGQIKIETTRNLTTDKKEYITQHSYDSKCILLIGNLQNEIKDCPEPQKDIMKKTFELYRRNSKNIDILTYDELFQRAEYICNKK